MAETPEQHIANAERFGYTTDPWAVEIIELRSALSAARTRVTELETALVTAAIPLEVLVASEKSDGPYREISPTLRTCIHEGVDAIRRALASSAPDPLPEVPTPSP